MTKRKAISIHTLAKGTVDQNVGTISTYLSRQVLYITRPLLQCDSGDFRALLFDIAIL